MTEFFSDPRAVAAVIAALCSLFAGWMAVRANKNIARAKMGIDQQANNINSIKAMSEKQLKEAQILADHAYRTSESMFRDLSLLRQDASVFLAGVEYISMGQTLTQEQKLECLAAAKRVSLLIPPSGKLAEDLNEQLQTGVLIIMGAEKDQVMSEQMMGLQLNLWQLCDKQDKFIRATLKVQDTAGKLAEAA
ncbi:hypothetical protein PhaeoP23_03984 (plasmid) [Phaeobacter piscinae]|uniref:Uncharacterized protein n=1 Tax=Phaeobacter piscinae TaxID=1580596 RepID=A0ABN5DKV1_9RHOB|nr:MULTISPECIES: hypothetical protein [Phaeobacter]ATG38137.1 hypothetical protein PhaeoP36_04062 [Phaeobacter piscinae]AUQ88658.1 hypothetical protein PhaeoP42_04063 [Phaeobacter piscinae]AUQ92657.1 hypothetical protein PhaeoP24_04099 [Phaeobacter inhibens]AUR26463.1 hypothetical protein PhaeoP23_03984 [Phaeobacter piscinae]